MPLTKVVPLPEPFKDENESGNKRLWIGNLDSRITEYQLLKILQKFGPIEKFDLLFHKTGPLAGQPRGYAFVTFADLKAAEVMKGSLDGKHLGSKALSVKWAHAVNQSDLEKPKIELVIPALAGVKEIKKVSRQSQIQAIESKLKMMARSSEDDFLVTEGPSSSKMTNPLMKQTPSQVNSNKQSQNKGKTRVYKPYQRR